jgi:hypothetical protein
MADYWAGPLERPSSVVWPFLKKEVLSFNVALSQSNKKRGTSQCQLSLKTKNFSTN